MFQGKTQSLRKGQSSARAKGSFLPLNALAWPKGFLTSILGWSEIGSKIFILHFQLARYVKRCQYISRTLPKNFKIFEKMFDLPVQLFILQYYAVLEVTDSLAFS